MPSNHSTTQGLIQGLLSSIPHKPGVYRMHDAEGRLLYVGKAKNLHKRLSSYQRPTTLRLTRLMEEAVRVQWDVTQTELDALHVEMQLIRSLKPKYNIIFQHGSPIPALCLSHHTYPRLCVTRHTDSTTSRLLVPVMPGPFLERFRVMLTQLFQLRSCSDTVFKGRSQPCLYHTLKRCSAPCVNMISAAAYQESVDEAYAFVQGRHSKLKAQWHKAMKEAAHLQDYERALVLRNRCQALEELERYGHHHFSVLEDGDVCAVALAEGTACVQVWRFRQGALVKVESSLTQTSQADTLPDILSAFLSSWYENSAEKSQTLLLSHACPDKGFLQDIAEARGTKLRVQVPQRGPKRHLVAKVLHQAQEALRGHLHTNPAQLMHQLKTYLELEKLDKVEIYDTSHLCGTFPRGAKVVFGLQGWLKPEFRIYGLEKITPPGGLKGSSENDLYLMEVMLLRRISNMLPALPDLMIVDGGEAQLAVAEKVCAIGGLTLPLLCITKGPHRKNETFILTHNGKRRTVVFQEILFHFLQRLRDEAHRFGHMHHRRRREAGVYAWFQDIPGLGAIGKEKLEAYLAHNALPTSSEELRRSCGLSQAVSKKVYESLILMPQNNDSSCADSLTS